MYQTALLLLTGSLRMVVDSIGQYLNCVNKSVEKCLYVKFDPELCKPFSKSDTVSLGRLSTFVPLAYSKASSLCKNVDVRVLLSNAKQPNLTNLKPRDFDVILTNSDNDSDINNYVELNFDKCCKNIKKLDKVNVDAELDPSVSDFKVYKNVCLGGTFDRLHNGHKVLLSEGILRASEKLIVGVSEGTMLKKKVLWELITPVEQRIEEVTNFLLDVDPSLVYEVVPILDPFGPTITDPNIDCIVVTTETKIGGEKVNIEREKKGMSELTMCVVNLVENKERSPDEDEKLSSSTQRMHLLGKPLKHLENSQALQRQHCILLRGHLMSGKSVIASRLQALGVPVLCCDEMLHAILKKDSVLRENVLANFPDSRSPVNGSFDLDKLLSECLKNKENKEWLKKAVYHKIKSTLKQVLEVYAEQDAHIIVVKDSTVFEGCDLEIEVHEIWADILPVPESIKQIKDKYSFTEEEAVTAMESLGTNEQYINDANIVFCTMWSIDSTKEQVDKAWSYLKSIQESR